MQTVLVVVLALHVLSSVFWAGSSFTLARTGGRGAAALFRPQMGAATVAVLTGLYLWQAVHSGPAGTPERVLGVGIAAAIVAAGVQGWWVGRGLKAGLGADGAPDAGIARAYRIASVLLMLTVVCMAIARYV